jgi:hypothetical protein
VPSDDEPAAGATPDAAVQPEGGKVVEPTA